MTETLVIGNDRTVIVKDDCPHPGLRQCLASRQTGRPNTGTIFALIIAFKRRSALLPNRRVKLAREGQQAIFIVEPASKLANARLAGIDAGRSADRLDNHKPFDDPHRSGEASSTAEIEDVTPQRLWQQGVRALPDVAAIIANQPENDRSVAAMM